MKNARAFALAVLNGSLDDELIVPFLDGLSASGYQGVCLHPRDGLLAPYNSRFYWDRVSHIIGLARARGLELWHYDEFPFPSGAAGGLIPSLYPEARMRELDFGLVEACAGTNGLIELGAEPLLALVRFREEGDGWHGARDVTGDTGPYFDTWIWGHWHNRFYTGTHHVREELHERATADRFTLVYRPDEPLQPSERLLAIRLRTVMGQKGQAGKPDLSRPDVSDAFLNLIYTRLSELSEKHQLTNTPVFQDEVTFGTEFPWNTEIERRLETLWGQRASNGDAWAHGFLSLWSPRIEGWENARFEFRRAAGEALENNWFERAARFCHANNLRVTGHLPGEESVFAHSQLMGDAFKTLRHFDVPGYDLISSHIPDELSSQSIGAKLVQSAAWLEGKSAMAEVFAANGFQNDLQENRSCLGWLAAHDFFRAFDHSTYSCLLSVRKYDAPPVNNRFNPLDCARADLWKWHGWLCDQLEEFHFSPQVLVLFPGESLARYRWSEEGWHEQTRSLERWFSHLCACSLDIVFLPSHRLDEVQALENGFQLRGHTFNTLLVPPFWSLHENVAQSLKRFANHDDFVWCAPDQTRTVSVFGPNSSGEVFPIPPKHVVFCAPDELERAGPAWFAPFFARASEMQHSQTVLQSLRRNDAGEELLLLLNPHESEVEVALSGSWQTYKQPPNYLAPYVEPEGDFVLAPRDVQLLRRTSETQPRPVEVEVRAQQLEFRWSGPNFLSLKHGVAYLEGFGETAFLPGPISSCWTLPLPVTPSEAIWAPPYSRAPIEPPLELRVCFEVELSQPLSELTVVWDAESLPPLACVCWDDSPLESLRRDVFDQNNTVFEVSPSALSAGKHLLKVEGHVSNGAQGVLERPILRGPFEVVSDGHAPLLRVAREGWMPLNEGTPWSELGAPEAFGPVEYRVRFHLDETCSQREWVLCLPPFVGVALVELNGQFIGQTAWEPRVVPLGRLLEGDNTVLVRVHGSWNNVFSALNRVTNGLIGSPVLRCVEGTQ